MQFRILGPLEVADDGRRVELGGHKQRAVLAVLLIRANEVVSQDRLIDALWGEAPPATAAKTLQAHISRLRRALDAGGAALETRGPGYVLRVEPGQLDAEVFATTLERARKALADGDAGRAAEQLRDALALWRGPALADFTYEPLAQAEIARLEEIRLGAVEERIEAELALSRHEALVPELETLVGEHPLRERLLRQLMLALYRSGRQAEALQAYERGRQALASELGLSPSAAVQQLHRQMLEQDEALAAPVRRQPPALVPEVARRHPRALVAAGALLLAAAIGAAVFQLTRDEEAVQAAGGLMLDPQTGEVVEAVPVGTAPSSVAIGEGGVWIVDSDDRTVSRIDPATRTLERTFAIASTPTDVAAGAGALWITNAAADESLLPASVSRVDPETGDVVVTIELPRSPGGHQFFVLAGLSRDHVSVTQDAVWVINQDQSISRIDPRTNRVVATIENIKAENIAAREGQIWITEGTRLTEIDPSRNRVARRVEIDAVKLTAVDIGGGAVWVADPLGGKVWRIDLGAQLRKRSIPVEMWTGAVAFGEGVVWAASEIGDEIQRIDPRTGRSEVVTRTTAPRDVEAGGGAVWVTAASPPSRDAALPESVCGKVFYGGAGRPRFLLVSDLPLKGSARRGTQAMVDGFRFMLQQRGFEAAGQGVGYQSCDSSTAQSGGSDFFRCGLNGKAYARNLNVVGVFGSYVSFCSYLQIPIANEAGPLAMISPSNTHLPLTTERTLYPTRVRNYVRLAAADHLQAVAHAVLAKQLGHRNVFILEPRQDQDFSPFARNVRTAAERLRLGVAGSARYDIGGADFTGVARRVAAARPDAVLLEGILVPPTARLIRDLRATLSPEVALIVPDGFTPVDALIKLAGPAATGMYVTNYGIPNAQLSPRGKRFLQSFAAARGGDPGPDFAAAYGAQGAEILLDAIARSDGTRASVTRALRETRVTDGILGDISFDRNGDLVEGPFTVFRVAGKRFVVDRVVTAQSRLLRSTASDE